MQSSSGRPFLVVFGGPDHGRTIPVRDPATILGRHRNGNVFVEDPTVSRRHAEIVRSQDGWLVRDLGSKNGTFVNRSNISGAEYQLKDGDEIRLGTSHVALVFRESTGHLPGGSAQETDAKNNIAGGPSTLTGVDEGSNTTESVLRPRSVIHEPGIFEGPGGAFRDEVYSGTVRLTVVTESDPQYLHRFVEELRRKSELGLLQVVSNSQKDADILLTLWKPVPLLRMLAEMDVGFTVSLTVNGTEVGRLGEFQGGPESRQRLVLVRLTADSL